MKHENPSSPPSSLPQDPSSALRHDVRNALTPAMMSADMLKNNADPKVQRHAQNIFTSLEKTLLLLQKRHD